MKEQEALEIFYNETESRWTDNTGWFNDEPKFEEPPAQRRGLLTRTLGGWHENI